MSANVNITIPLRKELFLGCGGLFTDVYSGRLTSIADRFQQQQGRFP
jgi:hypothetical protein